MTVIKDFKVLYQVALSKTVSCNLSRVNEELLIKPAKQQNTVRWLAICSDHHSHLILLSTVISHNRMQMTRLFSCRCSWTRRGCWCVTVDSQNQTWRMAAGQVTPSTVCLAIFVASLYPRSKVKHEKLIRILPTVLSICMCFYYVKHTVKWSIKAFGTHSPFG